MNFIKKLQRENEALKGQALEMIDRINDFKAFLLTEKFHKDTTIQTSDVQTWLTNIKQAGFDKKHEIEERE